MLHKPLPIPCLVSDFDDVQPQKSLPEEVIDSIFHSYASTIVPPRIAFRETTESAPSL